MAGGWELLSSRDGGTVTALATTGAVGDERLVFAASAAGVHRSTNGGRSWTTVALGSLPIPVEAIALSPGFAEDQTIFAGTPLGLYGSVDRGRSWRPLLAGSRVLAVVPSPSFRHDGVLFATTETDGILRSDDGGRAWTSANPGLLDLTVTALVLSPRFELDRIAVAATASGLYRTTNGGKSWREVQLSLDEPAIQCLAVSPRFADDGLILAGTEGDGLLRSSDAGVSWKPVPSLAGQSVSAISFSTRGPRTSMLAAATDDGVALSRDGAESWQLTGGELGPILSLTFTAGKGDQEALLAGLPKRGVARFDFGTRAWSPANDGLSGILTIALALSPAFPRDQNVFLASLEGGVAVSSDGGRSWTDGSAGLGEATVFGLALSPLFASDRTLFAATSAGIFRSRDGGAAWQPAQAEAQAAMARVVVAAPGENGEPPAVLAAMSGGLLISLDGGESWKRLGPGPGAAEILGLAISPSFSQDGTIFVATGPVESGGLMADAGGVVSLWRSSDRGERWQRWLVTTGAGILSLAVPATYSLDGAIFAGLGAHVMRPMARAREVIAGERRPIWQSVNLPGESVSITALATSRSFQVDGALFVATTSGVFRSHDRGETFAPWSEGLASIPAVALALSPDYASDGLVFAAGLGGAVWRRQDA